MGKSIRKYCNGSDIIHAAAVSPPYADGALRKVRQEREFDMKKILSLAMVTVLIGCATGQNLKGAKHSA